MKLSLPICILGQSGCLIVSSPVSCPLSNFYHILFSLVINASRPPDKSAYQKIIFLISQPKHMFKLMDKEIITLLRKKVLNWPFD